MGKTPPITCRKLTPADAESAAAFDLKVFGANNAFSRGYFFCAARDAQAEYLLAEIDGQIVGCIGAGIYDDTAEIETFAVDQKFRRRGIGKKIFARLLRIIKGRGAKFVILQVRPSNLTAIDFYEQFGFKIVDRLKNYYPDEDAFVMLLEF